MVYLDASVALAHLLAKDTRPPEALWNEPLIASRLTEYEVVNRLHALALDPAAMAAPLFAQVAVIDLVGDVIASRFPRGTTGLRTLDALHLASAIFLREQGADVRVATYDRRLAEAARQLGFELYPL